MTNEIHGGSPGQVARVTQDTTDVAGDAADQAERLSMVMEAEAIDAALHGRTATEGSLDGYDYPLADTEALLAEEDAEDASDDPMHAGGLDPAPWVPAEQAAMHIIDPTDPLDSRSMDDVLNDDDPDIDPFDRPGAHLTPEDETLLGVDPYE